MPIIINGSTFNNGGTANIAGQSQNEIKYNNITVWKRQISILTSETSETAWSHVTNVSGETEYTFSSGMISLKARYWTDSGRIAWAQIKLTDCTDVSRISFEYKNSTNPFAGIATYIGIVGRNWHPYYGTGTNKGGSDRATGNTEHNIDDALTANSTRMVIFPAGETSTPGTISHTSWTTKTFNLGSSMDLSNYYFMISTGVQASQTSGVMTSTLHIRNVIAI